MRKLSVHACGQECNYSTLCAAKLTGLSSLQKPQKSPSYICHRSKFCKWNMFQGLHYYISGRWSKFFSMFCSKISSGGFWFIEKLVLEGANFGGPFLPWWTLTSPKRAKTKLVALCACSGYEVSFEACFVDLWDLEKHSFSTALLENSRKCHETVLFPLGPFSDCPIAVLNSFKVELFVATLKLIVTTGN